MTEQEKINEIWNAFETAIENEFLADGILPHFCDKSETEVGILSFTLSTLWQDIADPKGAVIQFLNTLERCNFSVSYDNSFQSLCAIRTSFNDWIDICIDLGSFGCSASLLVRKDKVIWHSSFAYERENIEEYMGYEKVIQLYMVLNTLYYRAECKVIELLNIIESE